MNERLSITATNADPSEASWVVRELLRMPAVAEAGRQIDGDSAADGEVRQ